MASGRRAREEEEEEAVAEPSLKALELDSLHKNELSRIMDYLALEDLLILRGVNKALKASSEEHPKWNLGLCDLWNANGFNVCNDCEAIIPPPNPALSDWFEGAHLCQCGPPYQLCTFAATNDVRLQDQFYCCNPFQKFMQLLSFHRACVRRIELHHDPRRELNEDVLHWYIPVENPFHMLWFFDREQKSFRFRLFCHLANMKVAYLDLHSRGVYYYSQDEPFDPNTGSSYDDLWWSVLNDHDDDDDDDVDDDDRDDFGGPSHMFRMTECGSAFDPLLFGERLILSIDLMARVRMRLIAQLNELHLVEAPHFQHMNMEELEY